MFKRPNTIKMKRLLQDFIQCDRGNRQQLKELQEDAKRVLGFDSEVPAARSGKRAVDGRTRR